MSYEAAHDVALIGKKITEIVYESKIKFSYLAGTSPGGRTTLGEMQSYPEDYTDISLTVQFLLGHFIY